MKERYHALQPYIRKHTKIADLGIGKGYYYAHEEPRDVDGVDNNEKNLAKLRQHSPWVNVFVRDICNTGLPEKTYDLVVMSQIIEHLKDYWPAIAEAKRICKDDGYYLVATPIEDHHRLHFWPIWTEEDMKKIAEKLGEIVEIKKGDCYWLMYIKNK